MTQGEFDELLIWLVADWADRRARGVIAPGPWDEISSSLHLAIGGVVRWGQAQGLLTLTAAVAARAQAAVAGVRASYDDPALWVRVDADE
jgi:hypothetical protein